MAATLVTLTLATACGGDGDNVGPNTSPVAAFTAPACTTGTACSFTDASTDPDGSIASRVWDFGDPTSGGANSSSDANPTHTFATAGTYNVKLTVTDNGGASDDQINSVVVSAGGANVPPTASFVLPACTAGTPCGFHSTSTDPDGLINAVHWDFGDLGAADGPDATHTFAAAGPVSVTLTVTDDDGATGTSTQQLTVSPAASQDCTTTGTVVDCSLGITQASTVTVTLMSRSCELAGNRIAVTTPVSQTIFLNLCGRAIGETYTLKDATGGTLTLQPGTLGLRFYQGTADVGDPASGDPGIRITGTYPNWTLNIDDGGNAGALGEPDFDDAVLLVQATAAP